MKKFRKKKVQRLGNFLRFVGVRVDVATWVNKLALRPCLWNLYVESQPTSFYSF